MLPHTFSAILFDLQKLAPAKETSRRLWQLNNYLEKIIFVQIIFMYSKFKQKAWEPQRLTRKIGTHSECFK